MFDSKPKGITISSEKLISSNSWQAILKQKQLIALDQEGIEAIYTPLRAKQQRSVMSSFVKL